MAPFLGPPGRVRGGSSYCVVTRAPTRRFFPRAHAGRLPPPLYPPHLGGQGPWTPGRFAPVRHPGLIHESSWLDYNVFWTAVPPLGHGHVDHPSNQASVRPTVRRPGLPTYKTSIVLTATIFTLFKATTKETTKEVAAEGRATSFVVAAEGRQLCCGSE